MARCWTVVTVHALTSQEGASLKYSHAANLSLEEDMARKGLALNLILFYVKDIKGSRDFYVKKARVQKDIRRQRLRIRKGSQWDHNRITQCLQEDRQTLRLGVLFPRGRC